MFIVKGVAPNTPASIRGLPAPELPDDILLFPSASRAD